MSENLKTLQTYMAVASAMHAASESSHNYSRAPRLYSELPGSSGVRDRRKKRKVQKAARKKQRSKK